ncbi:hypothetical protein CEXT_198541 [Caerostris extrusa]|uniref:Uncharacterized protein n=1 Tax=Caerostris extrusa TaxID=172846 RepID=A0AAV4XUN1_CAEEX|nr:hypothetical protein CEXT_198541 [Caerostris extrusa]
MEPFPLPHPRMTSHTICGAERHKHLTTRPLDHCNPQEPYGKRGHTSVASSGHNRCSDHLSVVAAVSHTICGTEKRRRGVSIEKFAAFSDW